MTDNTVRDLPRRVWLWFIPLPLIVQLGVHHLDSSGSFFSRWIESESGLIENATALLLVPAVYFAWVIALRLYRRYGAPYFIWYVGLALVCFGFAGEEISWGQHWFGWDSPGYFAENNRQGETNFHNVNIHFGRVVKSILTLAIIVGGIIMPLRRAKRPASQFGPQRFWDVVTPSLVCVPVAVFVFGVRLVERCKTWFDLEWAFIAVNLKESQELYIAMFLLIYAWSAYVRTGKG